MLKLKVISVIWIITIRLPMEMKLQLAIEQNPKSIDENFLTLVAFCVNIINSCFLRTSSFLNSLIKQIGCPIKLKTNDSYIWKWIHECMVNQKSLLSDIAVRNKCCEARSNTLVSLYCQIPYVLIETYVLFDPKIKTFWKNFYRNFF